MVVPSLMRLWFRLGSLSKRDQRTEGVSPGCGGVGAVNRLGKRLLSCTRRWATMSFHQVITLPASALLFTSHSGCLVVGPSALTQLSPVPQANLALRRAGGRLGSLKDARLLCVRLARAGAAHREEPSASGVNMLCTRIRPQPAAAVP